MSIEVLVAAPAVEPVSVKDAKVHLRLDDDFTTDDAYLSDLISAARSYFEERTGRSLIQQDWKSVLTRFPGSPQDELWWDGVREGSFNQLHKGGDLKVNRPPYMSVVSITTYDREEAATVLDPAVYRFNTHDGKIKLKTGQTWPANLRAEDAVEVVYRSGYGDKALDVPRAIRHAILILVAHWYENREIILQGNAAVTMLVGEVPLTFSSLVNQFKVHRL